LIFKYDADTRDENLKDSGYVGYGCRKGIRDPDFWSNDFPVWAICGPYYRVQLRPDDVVFFVPKKNSIRKAGLKDYICAGILVVDYKITDSKKVMANNGLTDGYRQSYETDLKRHLKEDKSNRTKRIRPENFIVGDQTMSKWLGKNRRYLRSLLKDLGLHKTAKQLSQRRISYLNEEETKKLYVSLTAEK